MKNKTIKLNEKLQGSRRLIRLFLLAASLIPLTAFGDNFETGPRHVASAWNINRGALLFSTQGRFYTKHEIFTTPAGTASGIMVWDSQLSAMIAYGVTRFLEIDASPVILQSNHQLDHKTDSPGDLFISAKWSAPSLPPKLKTAIQTDVRLPLAQHHNVPLNPYSTDKTAFGVSALISFRIMGASPEKGLVLDANLGYFNFNDAGARLTDNPADSFAQASATQELRIATAIRWMGEQYGFYSEVLRRNYLTPPPATAYSLENSTYLSSGLLYQFNPYILLAAGVDVLLAGRNDDTRYESDGISLVVRPWQTIPNYPDWRVNMGVTFRLSKGSPAEPKVKEKEPEKLIATSTEVKEKKKKKTEKEKNPGEEKTTVDITDVKELERRLKEQKEQTVETDQEHQERMRKERERMEELLRKLHEQLRPKPAKEPVEEPTQTPSEASQTPPN
jgi:hypothetical protein